MESTFAEKYGMLEVASEDEGYHSEITSPVKASMEKEQESIGSMLNPIIRDVESQELDRVVDNGKQGAEYSVPAATKYTYLALYFGLNLGLTLFNKAVLGKVCRWMVLTKL